MSHQLDEFYNNLPEVEKVLYKLQGPSLYLMNRLNNALNGLEIETLRSVELCDRLDKSIDNLTRIFNRKK